jgi:hypothetical protein
MKIWIDDVRLPPSNEWVWAKTSSEAIDLICANCKYIEEISFDHDLGGNDTAYNVALVIEELAANGDINKFDWYVHSANPVGVARIRAALNNCERYWEEDRLKNGSFN